jgi:hypothetical protein
MNRLSQAAQHARDSLTNERRALKVDVDMSDANRASLYDALNGLVNSMSALVAYAGTPQRGTLGNFRTQYRPALAEWNRTVQVIYAETGQALPTLPTD